MKELYDSINNLKFEYLGPTNDARFYEYKDSKELFNSIKNNEIEFSEIKNKQIEFLNKLSNIKIGKKTKKQKKKWSKIMKSFIILENKLLIF